MLGKQVELPSNLLRNALLGSAGDHSVFSLVINTFRSGSLRLESSSLHMFCTGISPPMIVVESCSNPQKIVQVFTSAVKKNFGFGFHFIVSDIISGVVLGLFGPLHLAIAQTARWYYFTQVFIGN